MRDNIISPIGWWNISLTSWDMMDNIIYKANGMKKYQSYIMKYDG